MAKGGFIDVLMRIDATEVFEFLDSIEKTLQQAQITVQSARETVRKLVKIRDGFTAVASFFGKEKE